MPLTAAQARANILRARGSASPIGGLLSAPANDFRLAIRESLRATRASRLGKKYNLRGGGSEAEVRPSVRRPSTQAPPPSYRSRGGAGGTTAPNLRRK